MSKITEGIKVTGTPVALIASDWHVQMAAWKKFPEVKRDAEYSLEQIVDCAIEIRTYRGKHEETNCQQYEGNKLMHP